MFVHIHVCIFLLVSLFCVFRLNRCWRRERKTNDGLKTLKNCSCQLLMDKAITYYHSNSILSYSLKLGQIMMTGASLMRSQTRSLMGIWKCVLLASIHLKHGTMSPVNCQSVVFTGYASFPQHLPLTSQDKVSFDRQKEW